MKQHASKWKRIGSWLLALCLVLTMVPMPARAVVIGTCGENLTWELNGDGKMTISGTGSMDDYYMYSPWHVYADYIKTLEVAEGVTSIGRSAFAECSKLSEVKFPESLTSIDAYAFTLCAINEIEIGKNISYIGTNAFLYCSRLTAFHVSEENQYYSCSDEPILFDKEKQVLLQAFSNLSGTYSIPDSVEKIDHQAFLDCWRITELNIGSGVKEIGTYAFGFCSGLDTICFKGSAPAIDAYAFSGVTATVYYPADNSTWTTSARGNYGGSLTWLPDTSTGEEPTGNLCGDNVTWTISGSTLTITGEGPMWDYSSNNAPDWSGVTAVEIRGNVTSVGANAFYNADSIETVHIYSDVTTIGSGAFADCSKLSYVKFPESLQTIEDMAFAGCTNLGSMHTGVTIPDSVTDIGDWAFRGCTYMSKLKLGSGLKTIGSEAFYGCEKLTVVSIPDTVTNVGAYAFGECYGLQSVALSEKLLAIPEGLFHNNTSLKAMTIPNSVKTVGDYAFYNCKNMSSVTVGGSVLEIGSMAFAECTGIHTMYFNGNAPKIAANAMKNVTANVYYFELDETWDEDAKQNYGGELTWMPSRSISHITTDTSEYRSEMYIKIKPVDPDTGKFLDGVTVESLFGENSVDYPYFDIGRGYAEQKTMVFSKSDYRDYVIPTEVSASWKGYNQAAYSHNAYMLEVEKENEPYISTVFGRFSGEDAPYVDLQHTRLEVLPNQGYDIIITACGLEGKKVTYYIGQEGNGGVASSNGVFSSEILHSVLRENDTVLAYAVVDNKRVAEVELELRKTAESSYLADFLGGNENLSLLGEDALKVTIDKSVPVLGGTEIDFSAFTMPFGIEMDDNKVKISIGINVFETKNEGKGSEIQKWDAFKELVIDHSDGWSDAQEAIDKYKKSQEAFKAFCAKEKLTYAGWFDLPKHVDRGFNAGIVGYLECEERNGQLVVTEGKISINGEFSFEYVAQGSVWVIPTYGALDLKAKVGGDGLITQCLPESTIPFAMTWTVRAEPELTVRSGVGIKDAASAGLYGTGSLPITLSFTNETLTIDLKGKWGVEAELFTMQGEKTMWEGEMKLVDWHFGAEPEAVCLDAFETTTVTTVASRDYAETTSQWLRSENQTMSLAADMTALDGGVTFEKLQTSIFANSQPQMVTVGDRMLLTWIQDAPDRDSYNRMRLVYSVYDPTFNTWSEPAAVWDDGHNDGYPRMVSNGQTAWVLWQKVNTTLTEENSNGIDAILENTELCLARFDLHNGLFSEQQMLTDNDLFEYAHSLNLVNGNPSVCWATAENNALNVFGCHTLTNWKGGFGETIGENLNYLLSVDAMEGQVTYVMDADGNLETVRDVTAFTVTGSGTTVFDNSENGKAITYAAYGSLNGEPTLFLSDMSNVCYQENGQWKKVFPVNRSMAGELNILKTDQGTTILWTETVQGWSELYSVSFRNGSWSEPVRISNNGERISQVSAVYINGRITGVCNTNKMVYDEITGEYAQEVADLSLFHISDFVDLALGQSLSVRESELKAGEETQLYVTVYNNGTKAELYRFRYPGYPESLQTRCTDPLRRKRDTNGALSSAGEL